MDIIDLQQKDRKKTADMLARAFFDYPSFICYFPDEHLRKQTLSRFMDCVLKCALRYGSVYTQADLSGVLFTLSGEHSNLSDWEYIQNGFLVMPLLMGYKNFQRMIDCEEFTTQMHEELMKSKPHEYIWGLAVDPKRRAKGVGAGLLHRVLDEAGRRGRAVYLETHLERNVGYYENHGFHLLRSAVIPSYGLRVWAMVWEPDMQNIIV